MYKDHGKRLFGALAVEKWMNSREFALLELATKHKMLLKITVGRKLVLTMMGTIKKSQVLQEHVTAIRDIFLGQNYSFGLSFKSCLVSFKGEASTVSYL